MVWWWFEISRYYLHQHYRKGCLNSFLYWYYQNKLLFHVSWRYYLNDIGGLTMVWDFKLLPIYGIVKDVWIRFILVLPKQLVVPFVPKVLPFWNVTDLLMFWYGKLWPSSNIFNKLLFHCAQRYYLYDYGRFDMTLYKGITYIDSIVMGVSVCFDICFVLRYGSLSCLFPFVLRYYLLRNMLICWYDILQRYYLIRCIP